MVSANPTLILLLIVYSPLRSSLNQILVAQLSLNYQLLRLHAGNEQTQVIHPPRLHNVSKLDSFADVFPLLVVKIKALILERHPSVHLHHSSLHRTRFFVFVVAVF